MVDQTFRRKSVYADIDMDFGKNPLTNDISVKRDSAAIAQSFKNLISTNFFERPFQPFIGSNIRALLFEPVDPIVIENLRQQIRELATNYEPRVNIVDIIVSDRSDMNAYSVSITYRINDTDEPVSADVILERLR